MDKIDLFTKEECFEILQNKLGTTNFKILETSYAPFSDTIEGFLGEHYILKMTFIFQNQELEESFFIKTVPNKNPSQKKILEKMCLSVKETYMYEKVFPRFEEMNYGRSVPRCYFIKNDETIVMENLKDQGYGTVERFAFLDLEHCKAALDALALFHANSIAYEESRSKELGRAFRFGEDNPEAFKEVFFTYKDPQGLSERYHQCGKKCIAALAQFFPRSAEWKANFAEKVINFNYAGLYETPLPFRKTCGHGDLWPNNLLFKKTGSTIECVLIDFQITRYSHPSIDSLLLIYTSTPRSLRKLHKSALLDFHYDRIEFYLQSYGYDLDSILSKRDYLESARIFEPLACFQAVRNKTLTHLPLEIVNKINSNGINFGELLFSDIRIKMVTEAFQSSEEFRKILSDDVYDIDELF